MRYMWMLLNQISEQRQAQWVSVKELNLPERFAPAGAFDLSCLHSHSLWHVCVWLLQMCYARSFFAHLGPGNGTGILLTGVDWVVAR